MFCHFLQDEKNLIIPIHSYPVMNTSEFPQLIDFPAVSLGETYVLLLLLHILYFDAETAFLHHVKTLYCIILSF